MAFLNIKKKNNNKNKNGQFIKSVDSYNGNGETFVYNSYPNNQMNNNQNPMNYQNNMNQNGNYPMNNMNYNQPMNNQMVNNQVNNNQMNNNVIQPNIPKQTIKTVEKVSVIKPKLTGGEEPAIDTLEEPEEVLNETDLLEEMPVEKNNEALDPLNNANNPIPVNPVAPVEEKEVLTEEEMSAKADIFAVFGMTLGMIFKPGVTVVDSVKKYKTFFKSMMITLWVTIATLLATVIVRIVAGAFYRSYNSITGAYSINVNFGNVFTLQNFLPYIIVALVCSLIAILVMTLIYYASSFFNSRGVPFGAYLAVSNVSLIPLILGVVVLYPILNILSDYLGIAALIVTFIYSLSALEIGIDYILKFNNSNTKIYYNVFNLSLVILIMVIIVSSLINFNLISPPTLFT